MQKSEFTLKGHKQMQGMDGYVYSGTLLHNGMIVCKYFDDGNGGGMMLNYANKEIQAKFEGFIKSLPYTPSSYFPDGLEPSTDGFIEDIIVDQEQQKKLKRALKTKTVFRLKGDKDGDFRTVSGGAYSEASKAWLVKKFGDKLAMIYDQNGQVAA